MEKIYKLPSNPIALADNVIQGEKYRFTVLTPGLIRLEYSDDGIFEDRSTQTVLNRDFPKTDFLVKETDDELEIVTWRLRLNYNKKEFSPTGLSIRVIGDCAFGGGVWYFGQKTDDLKGTARTLDEVDGECELGSGLISKRGFSVLDDSRSLAITEEGWVAPRKKGIQDIYFWGYGQDYLECLKDFYYLCGKTPMIPRFALGNWWSRYYKYTEESYLELLNRFDEEEIPFSVAVIDMDWHLVDIDPKYGSGWTGYTWNKDFFPDPKRFMDELHERGMRITLNVHPADGVRGHEEMYQEMALALGKDISIEEPIAFDIADPAFLAAYFKYLHHPQEKNGVDFWWIDWQQGGVTKVEGLDPLWMLNHFHYLDSAREGKRPMTFSRYAGPGSHRYPVGFSGDTAITWESLKFQPYFTATATNIGYGWWSHDIGGHMWGYKNDELEARWYQLGVFSPVNRLHSSNNEFSGKEPWRFKKEVRDTMDDFLRLRHALVPYLYTMNHRAHEEDIPMVLPMYYHHAGDNRAYYVPNQYYFGSELIVMPVTSPRIEGINRAKEKVWLPEGTYIDFFTGVVYEGDRMIHMYRGIENIPVLAKTGAIVPMQMDMDDVSQNPDTLVIRMFAGADGQFALYEDDNETCDYEKGICATTQMYLNWNGDQSIVIKAAEGNTELLPGERTWCVELVGGTESGVICKVDGQEVDVEWDYDADAASLLVTVPDVKVTSGIEITFENRVELIRNNTEKLVYDFLNQAEIEFGKKSDIIEVVRSGKSALIVINELQSMGLDEDLIKCVTEILTAQG